MFVCAQLNIFAKIVCCLMEMLCARNDKGVFGVELLLLLLESFSCALVYFRIHLGF